MHASYTVPMIFFPLSGFCLFFWEWPLGCALLTLTVAAHHCKARPHCTIWLLFPLFPPLFSDWAVVDVFMVGNQLLVWQCWVIEHMDV